jgi:hypothetical protein
VIETSGRYRDSFVDDFDEADLDPAVWLPSYLPAWSSQAASVATYRVSDSILTLELPAGSGHWCPEDHQPPLRVSGIQSGNHSGPVGSSVGQQPFRAGQRVKEQQPTFRGFLQDSGRLEIRCRMRLSPRSMAAFWLVGFEDRPERSGEICVTEIFGKDVDPGRSAKVGMGIHRFRDPALTEDFAAPELPIDVTDFHDYAVSWNTDRADFTVDGASVRRCAGPPRYPLQMMLAVFDFPGWSGGDDEHLVPGIDVDHIVATG